MTVCVVATASWEIGVLTKWGALFAYALEQDLSVLYVQAQTKNLAPDVQSFSAESEKLDPLLKPGAQALADFEQRRSSFTRSLDAEISAEFRVARTNDPLDSVLDTLREVGASLLLLAKHEATKADTESALPKLLFEEAPCHTILLRPGKLDPADCKKVVVPASGGPHALAALQVTLPIVRDNDGTLVPLFIEPPGVECAQEVGMSILTKILKKAGIADEPVVAPQVVLSDRIESGIQQAVAEGVNLLILGASNAGTVRRTLFGTIPQNMLDKHDGEIALAVIRSAKPITTRIHDRFERWLDLTVPQLEREDRIDLFERLQAGSAWNFDFLALISLSTAIATLGLLQNSAAVVIGAMLVAPLMTPLLGAGLAMVQGNVPLLKDAVKSITLGFLCALVIGFCIGWIVPNAELTTELVARGGPTLLDMAVALLSGIAAAHCSARPNLSSALPGVAIAAALVPPIATTGVALAIGAIQVAEGAALLFATNVVAIIIGSSFSLYSAGVRIESSEDKGYRFTRRALTALLVIMMALAVPLTSFLISKLPVRSLGTERKISAALVRELEQYLFEKRLATIDEIHLYEGEVNSKPKVVMHIRSAKLIKPRMYDALRKKIEDNLGRPVELRAQTRIEWSGGAGS